MFLLLLRESPRVSGNESTDPRRGSHKKLVSSRVSPPSFSLRTRHLSHVCAPSSGLGDPQARGVTSVQMDTDGRILERMGRRRPQAAILPPWCF